MKKLVIGFIFLFCCISALSAQNVKIEKLNGEHQSFSEVIKGDKPVIVSFWATWCKPCINEMEAMKEIRDRWEGKVRVVSISIDDSRSKSKVPSFVKARNLPFEFYLDSNQELYKNLNATSVPFIFIYNKGKQVYKHNGYNPGDEEYLVDEALKYVK